MCFGRPEDHGALHRARLLPSIRACIAPRDISSSPAANQGGESGLKSVLQRQSTANLLQDAKIECLLKRPQPPGKVDEVAWDVRDGQVDGLKKLTDGDCESYWELPDEKDVLRVVFKEPVGAFVDDSALLHIIPCCFFY